MKAKNFALLIPSIAVLWILTATGASASRSCPIAQSIYRDGDGKGFQLVFGAPLPGSTHH
jgi:hypothetical protein